MYLSEIKKKWMQISMGPIAAPEFDIETFRLMNPAFQGYFDSHLWMDADEDLSMESLE